MTDNYLEDAANSDFNYDRINQENPNSNNNERNVRLNRRLQSCCVRCCSFSYNNSSQLTAAICFALIFLLGILKIIFGSVSLSSGYTAIILAKQDNLHWSGVFSVSLYSLGFKGWPALSHSAMLLPSIATK